MLCDLFNNMQCTKHTIHNLNHYKRQRIQSNKSVVQFILFLFLRNIQVAYFILLPVKIVTE